jgi:hypothetical protein
MKNIKFFTFLVPIGLLLLQGCYTRLAYVEDQEPAYAQEEQSTENYNDSTFNNDNAYSGDYDQWQSHSYIGFDFYYPTWRSYWWGGDYCYYPTYWSWWWTPSIYPYYSYYPYHLNYWGWDYYPYYGYHSGSYWHNYSNRSYTTRDFGNQRGGKARRDYGVVRSSTSGSSGSTIDSRRNSTRGDISIPRAARVSPQRSGTATKGNASRGVSTSRSRRGEYKSSAQQPRQRSGSAATKGGVNQRGSSDRGSRGSYAAPSRQSSPAPRYSSPPQRSSSPPSAPAPRSSDGGERSSGSGRSSRR